MLGFPVSTEFNKRIPKQKFYDNLDVSPTLRRVFVDQIRLVYWRNKLAASTLNIAAGEAVTEIEVFEVRLNAPKLDEAVLKQIDKEIPYHLLFILTCDGKAQAWIGYKEAAASGSNAFKVNRYYHTDWMPEDELQLRIDGLNMDTVYESLVCQIAGDMIGAYDEQAKHDEKLLDLAEKICEWLRSIESMIDPEILLLNKIQITKRRRTLSMSEIVDLAKLTESKYPPATRCGAYLLMDADKEAQECFDELSPIAQEEFIKYPICHFGKLTMKEDILNG